MIRRLDIRVWVGGVSSSASIDLTEEDVALLMERSADPGLGTNAMVVRDALEYWLEHAREGED